MQLIGVGDDGIEVSERVGRKIAGGSDHFKNVASTRRFRQTVVVLQYKDYTVDVQFDSKMSL